MGLSLGQKLSPDSVICFTGDLGAGKTTLIKGIVKGATGTHEDSVNSPTYVYLNIYEGEKTVYHFDLYRLNDIEEFLSMGFEEMFSAGGLCCIEWSERIAPYVPETAIVIRIEHLGEDQRAITIVSEEALCIL